MSSLRKLQIQGIRSFGTREEERQSISFSSPVTIIEGCNGCGKTTIIECLRYITSGELPPGVKGPQFVHDPKVANESEVKAQVRLMFNDTGGNIVSVTRSMQVTQKAKKADFRTIESVINRHDEKTNKPTSSISSKCADIDKEVSISLGVSKAVLTNVIFCHQEDSNWPLEDAKSVKSKFDEIFSASRYIKCLDVIKKTKQNLLGEVKQCEIELGYLKANKNKFNELTKNMNEAQLKLQDSLNSLTILEDEREILDKQDQEVTAKLKEINGLNSKKEFLLNSIKEKVKNINQLRAQLESDGLLFKGSDYELQQKIENVKELSDERVRKRDDLSRKIEDEKLKIEQLKKQLEIVSRDLSTLKSEFAVHDKDVDCRDDLVMKIGEYLGLTSDCSPPLSEDEIKDFQQQFSRKVKLMETTQSSKKEEFAVAVQKQELVIDEAFVKLNNAESEIKRCSTETESTSKELENVKTQLAQIEKSGVALESLKKRLAEGEGSLRQIESSCDIEAETKILQASKMTLEDKQADLGKLMNEMSVVSRNAAVQEKLNTLRSEISKKESANSRILMRREDDLKSVLGELPEKNLKTVISSSLEEKKEELKTMTENMNEMKVKLEKLKFQKASCVDQLAKSELERSEIKRKIEIPEAGYDSEITHLTQTIKDTQNKLGCLKGSTMVYSEFCAKMKAKNPKCPVCYRGFSGTSEAKEVSDRLEELKKRVPANVKSEEIKLKEKEEKLKNLHDSRPIFVQLEKLNSEIPGLQETEKKLTTEINELSGKKDDLEMSCDFLESEIKMLSDAMPDLNEFERNERDLVDLREKLLEQEIQLSSQFSSRSLDEIECEKMGLESSIKELKKGIEVEATKLDKIKRQKSEIQESILKLKNQMVEVTSQSQKVTQFVEKKNELERKISEMVERVNTLDRQLGPLKSVYNQAKEKKVSIGKDKDFVLQNLANELSKVRNQIQQLEDMNEKVNSFNSAVKQRELKRLEEKNEDLKKRQAHSENAYDSFVRDHNSVKEEIAKEATIERAWHDNVSLRKLVGENKEIQSKVSEIDQQLGEFDERKLLKEKDRLMQEQERKSRSYYETKGRIEELEKSRKEMERQAGEAQYKEAPAKYRNMLIKEKTSKLASVDLDKYSKALDSAIMRFHSVKMEEINGLMADLWREVYTGGDIDTIEIRTEEGENSTATRKTYNYRVVMIKEGVELDMRGRCSAGQKVLACLIIRLALAETFCLNCGVFSLDEPTTNLDRENIESLAESLIRIIKSRAKQQNFQFLIITHDTDFVELLGMGGIVEHYYRVSRSVNGLSTIHKKDFSQIGEGN